MLQDVKTVSHTLTSISNVLTSTVTYVRQLAEQGHTVYRNVSSSYNTPEVIHVWNRRKSDSEVDFSFVLKDRVEVLNAAAGGGNTSSFHNATVTFSVKCDRPKSDGLLVGTSPFTDARLAGYAQKLIQFMFLEGGLTDSTFSRVVRGDQ